MDESLRRGAVARESGPVVIDLSSEPAGVYAVELVSARRRYVSLITKLR